MATSPCSGALAALSWQAAFQFLCSWASSNDMRYKFIRKAFKSFSIFGCFNMAAMTKCSSEVIPCVLDYRHLITAQDTGSNYNGQSCVLTTRDT
jgi:hypothetical protein